MIDAEGMLELLSDLEEHHPVGEWTVGGIRIWPLVRMELWWTGNSDYAALRAEARSESVLARRARQLVHQPRDLARWAASRVRRRDHAPLARADAVVFGDAVSRIKLDGAWFDRLTDPIIEALHELGLSALQLEPYHLYRSPLRRPARHIQTDLDAIWLRSRAARAPLPAELPGHADLVRDAEAVLGAAGAIREPDLLRQGHHLQLLTRWFERALETAGSRLGVLVDHGIVQMAFNAACVRRGIPSVEVQHGVMTANGAYSGWRGVPPDGYELLPSHYWCWGRREVEEIESWSAGSARHAAVLGGNLWLRNWQDGSDPVIRRFDRVLGDRPRHDQVLVTLSRGFTGPEELGPVGDAIRADNGRRRWWVRAHPAMSSDEFAAAMARLRPEGGAEVAVADPDIPLYAFLRNAGAHVTAVSSTTIEARALGVPTVLTNPTAPGLFPAEARDGWAVLAADGESLLLALERFAGSPPEREPEDAPRPAAELLAEILA